MNERANRGIQGANHLAIAYVDANVRPVVGAVGILHHYVPGLGVRCFNHRHPLLSARQSNTSLGVGPLDETGTVPAVVKAGAAPNIGMTQTLIGGRKYVFAHLGDELCGDFRDGSAHGIRRTGQVGRVAIGVCQVKRICQINNLLRGRLLGLDQRIGEGQLHPHPLGGKSFKSGRRSRCNCCGDPNAVLKTKCRGVGRGGVGISGCNEPP